MLLLVASTRRGNRLTLHLATDVLVKRSPFHSSPKTRPRVHRKWPSGKIKINISSLSVRNPPGIRVATDSGKYRRYESSSNFVRPFFLP